MTAAEEKQMCNILVHMHVHGASPAQLVHVQSAIAKLGATIPFWQILMTILPFILGIFTGQPIDFQALIAAILALNTPTPPAK